MTSANTKAKNPKETDQQPEDSDTMNRLAIAGKKSHFLGVIWNQMEVIYLIVKRVITIKTTNQHPSNLILFRPDIIKL